ncbi:synaptic vesicular amine transporter-like [Cydia pomonella]|uniref:synaptic vesicular amine transporter-like n=1 Tax=Cydia pomonella TaxID=82600 RepID=UPI002ADD7791|nr:synaptic vesicular amine transporter-like [Cydia pomonella]
MSAEERGLVAFVLVYLTFFLDNVLLTVLVPIIPDWVRGDELARWTAQDAPPPLAALLNHTVRHAIAHDNDTHAHTLGKLCNTFTPTSVALCPKRDVVESVRRGGSTAVVGVVLGAKAAAQLAAAPWAARAACGGAARALGAGTTLLAGAAGVFAACGAGGGAWCAGAGRVLHGAGSALAGVAGLALAAACAPQRLPALLGAVALGVLVGYPTGGLLDATWSFLLLAALLLVNLALQCVYLRKEEFNRVTGSGGAWFSARGAGYAAPAAACAGCVLLTTCVMAALEPTLPPWIRARFHPQRWQTGIVFVPDSAGYLLATSCAGLAARALGAERVALAGQAAVGVAALALPHAPTVWWLALPHAALGGGLGAADAALVPALLARAPRQVPHLAALLQAASSAAYALGPALGGLLAWRCGFATALRVLGAANLLYGMFLYTHLKKHPLSPQWGASTPDDDDSEACESGVESTPLRPRQYTQLQ